MSSELISTVLIVEDDPGVARLQQVRLERAGYTCKIAATATDALALVRGGGIDLMLLDQNLPGGVNGLDLYAHVKELGFDIPAILVTGFTGDAIVLQSLRAGLHDFVPKTPDYMDYLLPAIERVLRKRRTESMLVESEARLGSIIRSAIDAVLTVDETQQVGVFNPAAEQMFGLKAEDIHRKPIQQILPAWRGTNGWAQKDDGEAPCPGEQIEHWETEGVRADGSRFPVELSVSWVEANRRRFWTCFARDITERKKAQDQREKLIREQAARLEAEVARERLETLYNENSRLYRELQQEDRLKDEFLAMLAHELRNPLAPIRNALELILLENPPPSPSVHENLEIIKRQVTHMVRLVGDLLDVSRISQGKIVLRKESLDVADVVARALETSQPLIAARHHSLRVEVAKGPLPVEGDLVRLVQVVANLLNNAAKYTPEGGRIELLVERIDGQAVFRVRDNGVGIPKEIQPRLFELFTQSDRTLDRAEGGLGVGLTLVRRLTEMHGGAVEAKSEGLGRGSEFIVRLPLTDKMVSTPQAPPASAPSPPAGHNRRVLVVDDNRDSAKTLTRLLQVLGHDVLTAHDGEEALRLAERFAPEIVLLDLGLPGLDGFEVARRLRASTSFDATVLIALTGYGSPEDRAHSREAGFNAHLVKPVDLEALKYLLAQPLELLRLRKEG